MSLKDVPVRARLWAPDRSLPRFFGRLLLFLSDSTLRLLPSTFGRRKRAEVSLKRAVLHPRATIKYESVAQGSRAAPLATKMYESVAQGSRAAPSGNDKCGFRCRRVSFIHTSFCPAPLGNGKARKSRLTVPRVTFGCGTVRRHRSRRARRRPLLLSLDGFRWPVAWSCGHYIRIFV